MYYLIFLREIKMKKKSFRLKALKFFIVYNLQWQMLQFQVLMPWCQAFCLSIRSQSAELTFCHSSADFEIFSKPSLPMRDFIKPVLVVWGSGCKSCRRLIVRLKDWGNQKSNAIKKSIRFFTIKAYRLYPKPFKWSWSTITTTIF